MLHFGLFYALQPSWAEVMVAIGRCCWPEHPVAMAQRAAGPEHREKNRLRRAIFPAFGGFLKKAKNAGARVFRGGQSPPFPTDSAE